MKQTDTQRWLHSVWVKMMSENVISIGLLSGLIHAILNSQISSVAMISFCKPSAKVIHFIGYITHSTVSSSRLGVCLSVSPDRVRWELCRASPSSSVQHFADRSGTSCCSTSRRLTQAFSHCPIVTQSTVCTFPELTSSIIGFYKACSGDNLFLWEDTVVRKKTRQEKITWKHYLSPFLAVSAGDRVEFLLSTSVKLPAHIPPHKTAQWHLFAHRPRKSTAALKRRWPCSSRRIFCSAGLWIITHSCLLNSQVARTWAEAYELWEYAVRRNVRKALCDCNMHKNTWVWLVIEWL